MYFGRIAIITILPYTLYYPTLVTKTLKLLAACAVAVLRVKLNGDDVSLTTSTYTVAPLDTSYTWTITSAVPNPWATDQLVVLDAGYVSANDCLFEIWEANVAGVTAWVLFVPASTSACVASSIIPSCVVLADWAFSVVNAVITPSVSDTVLITAIPDAPLLPMLISVSVPTVGL